MTIMYYHSYAKKYTFFSFIKKNVKLFLGLIFDDQIFYKCDFFKINVHVTYDQNQIFEFCNFWHFDRKKCEKSYIFYISYSCNLDCEKLSKHFLTIYYFNI